LSEDLDFTGGRNFNRALLHELGSTLVASLVEKYSLPVSVSEPQREEGNAGIFGTFIGWIFKVQKLTSLC
jgi:hypothetical protein